MTRRVPRHPTEILSFFKENSKISIVFRHSIETSSIFQNFRNLGPQWRGAGIVIFTFYHIHIHLQHTLCNVFCAFSQDNTPKHS